jgi:hypothetical protein
VSATPPTPGIDVSPATVKSRRGGGRSGGGSLSSLFLRMEGLGYKLIKKIDK